MDLKLLKMNFDGVIEHQELRRDQFGQWRRGELDGKAARAYEKWLMLALAKGRVVAVEPGKTAMVYNFARAAAGHIMGGARRATEETAQRRLGLCQACELFDKKRTACRHPRCGCFLKRKTIWASESCPIGKWGREPKTAKGPEAG